MNLKELKEDLLNRTNVNKNTWTPAGFTTTFFDNENTYNRRSFNDLIKYYQKHDVTEQMLMQAIKDLKFIARYCDSPKKVVFWIPEDGKERNNFKFWWNADFRYTAIKVEDNLNAKFEKYTPTYLEELYDKCE